MSQSTNPEGSWKYTRRRINMNPVTEILYSATLGAIWLWRKLISIFVYIGFKPVKAHINKTFSDCGVEVNGTASHDIVVHNDWFYHRFAYDGTLGFAEAYMEGWWDCERLDQLTYKLLRGGVYKKLPPWEKLIHYLNFDAFNLQTVDLDAKTADLHYNQGNEVFKSFMDANMSYTCGFWKDAKNLDEAQIHKMDLIGRKLKLKPGMKVLDLGCGWGGLCQYLAENFKVQMVGVTNSKEGVKEGRLRCKGLNADIRLQDYREINEVFDRIVSVGFFEHVGRKNHRSLFELAHRCLADDGIFLLQTIGLDNDGSPPVDLFMTKYFFPSFQLPDHKNIPKAIDNLFSIEDWHNFGLDYDKTQMAWHDNFVKNWHTISHRFENPDFIYRMWKYLFCLCAGAFRSRRAQLWQIVMTKGFEGGYVSIR